MKIGKVFPHDKNFHRCIKKFTNYHVFAVTGFEREDPELVPRIQKVVETALQDFYRKTGVRPENVERMRWMIVVEVEERM